MGQFIRLRLTNELYVLKKDRWGCAYDTDRITDMLNSWFNMQLYDAEELEDQIPLYLQDELEFQVDNERLTFTAVDTRKAPVPAKNSQLSLFDEDER